MAPYAKSVPQTEREEDMKEYADFLDELTAGSFTVMVVERKDRRSVSSRVS